MSQPTALPAYIQPHPDGVYLAIRLQPRASRDEIGPIQNRELKVKVTAPPVDAAANEALLRLLADRLGCARSALHLVRGHRSRHKLVFAQGISPAQAATGLGR
jgi:uncharacterized protein (TIGR00251 family)